MCLSETPSCPHLRPLIKVAASLEQQPAAALPPGSNLSCSRSFAPRWVRASENGRESPQGAACSRLLEVGGLRGGPLSLPHCQGGRRMLACLWPLLGQLSDLGQPGSKPALPFSGAESEPQTAPNAFTTWCSSMEPSGPITPLPGTSLSQCLMLPRPLGALPGPGPVYLAALCSFARSLLGGPWAALPAAPS